jgi:hypothetical protein
MDPVFINSKIGDEVYSPDVSYRPFQYGKVVRGSGKSWIIHVDGRTEDIRVRRADGYEFGTNDTGRFGYMSRKHWYLMTEERKRSKVFQQRCQDIRAKIKMLSDRGSFQLYSGNLDAIEKHLIQILALGSKS